MSIFIKVAGASACRAYVSDTPDVPPVLPVAARGAYLLPSRSRLSQGSSGVRDPPSLPGLPHGSQTLPRLDYSAPDNLNESPLWIPSNLRTMSPPMNRNRRDHRAVAAFAKRRVREPPGTVPFCEVRGTKGDYPLLRRRFAPGSLSAACSAVCRRGRRLPLHAAQRPRLVAPEYSRVAAADFRGPEAIVVHNVHGSYRTDKDFDVRYEGQHYDLTKLDRVDYMLVPFTDIPRGPHVCHLRLSRRGLRRDLDRSPPLARPRLFAGRELRQSQARSFTSLATSATRSACAPVSARTTSTSTRSTSRPSNARPSSSTCSRGRTSWPSSRVYNTLTNNCLTNVVARQNRACGRAKIAYGYDVLFPGYSDQLIYNLGLVHAPGTFEQAREASHINHLADLNRDSPRLLLAPSGGRHPATQRARLAATRKVLEAGRRLSVKEPRPVPAPPHSSQTAPNHDVSSVFHPWPAFPDPPRTFCPAA